MTTSRFEEEVATLRELRRFDEERLKKAAAEVAAVKADLKTERIKSENRLMQGLAMIAEAASRIIGEAVRP